MRQKATPLSIRMKSLIWKILLSEVPEEMTFRIETLEEICKAVEECHHL